MKPVLPFPPLPAPPPAVSRILARYDRPKLEAFIAIAIDLLDTMDGDTDLESPGAEDDFVIPYWQRRVVANGPGCPVSDPGGGNVEDNGEDDDEREPEDDLAPSFGVDQAPLDERKRP
ncbi:MAG TPA: hypothetical protein VF463_19100 [Sphingobium sp.]